MLTIYLKDVKFRAFHGVYKEELVVGGDFLVNLQVSYAPDNGVIADMNATVNYELLFALLKQEMEIPTPLIETVAMKVAHKAFEQFEKIVRVKISIEKCNPPIEKLEGSVMISYEAERTTIF
jgi:7,8-dihydroneopterin aldolase/epimerase/oxygenase